jgi:lysyl-tRNA synthetase class I
MKENLKESPEEKPSNILISKEIVATVSISLLFTLMFIMGIIQHDKNKKLKTIISSLMSEVMKDKVDFLDSDLKNIRNYMKNHNDISDLLCRVQTNEIALHQYDELFKLMIDTDQSIMDACNASIEALQASIEMGTFCEYIETYNNIKIVQKMGE